MPKTIRVNEDEYQKIIEARKELAKHGYAGVLPLEQEEEIDLGSFTIGAIAALGAVALIYLLTKDNEE